MNTLRPALIEGDVSSVEARSATADAVQSTRDAGSDHEDLLIRHGLISHIATLEDGASEEQVAAFLRDASRQARNTIRLASMRFGLHFGSETPAEISDIPHHLASVIRSGSIKPNTLVAGPSLDSVAGVSASQEGDRPLLLQDPAAQDAERSSGRDLMQELAPLLEATLRHHLEPIEQLRAGILEEHDRWRSESADFWRGMEGVLRMLDGSLKRLEALSDAPKVADPEVEKGRARIDDVLNTMRALESRIVLGLQESDERQNARQTRLEEHFASLQKRAPATKADLTVEVAALHGAIGDLGGVARAGTEAAVQPVLNLLAPVSASLDGLRSRIEDVAQGLEATDRAQPSDALTEALDEKLTALTSAISDLGHAHDGAINGLAGNLQTVHAILASHAPDEAALQRIEAGLNDISDALNGRGGVISEAVETSSRTMKNFWLACEDAVQRLEVAVVRLEGNADGEETVSADELRERLDYLRTVLDQEADFARTDRLGLAELLACQLRGSRALPPNQ